MELRLLQLILDGTFNQNDWVEIDWDHLLKMARRNLILIRVGDLLKKNGAPLPPDFLDQVVQEKRRVGEARELIQKISHLCADRQVPFILPTALQHSPDMGGDVDILVPDDSRRIDSIILEEMCATPLPSNFFNFISTESSFLLPSSQISIEIRHGRLGLIGEHRSFTSLLFKNSKMVDYCGIRIRVPSDEDHLLLQIIQRLYGRFYFRISDLVCPILLLRRRDLDWDYLFRIASLIGISGGLRFYMSCLNRIHQDLLSCSLVPSSVQKSFISNIESECLVFKKSYYRYPMLSVTGKLYWEKWRADLFSGRLTGAFRLSLLPLVAGSFCLRNFLGHRSRYFQ